MSGDSSFNVCFPVYPLIADAYAGLESESFGNITQSKELSTHMAV